MAPVSQIQSEKSLKRRRISNLVAKGESQLTLPIALR